MSKEQLAEYSELAGKQVEVADFMTYIMKYMMDKGLKLENTEGMIEASLFPVNYFTLKQVRSPWTSLQAYCTRLPWAQGVSNFFFKFQCRTTFAR